MTARGQYWAANRGRRVPRAGTVRGNKYPATCAKCGGDLPAGRGVVTFLGGRWVPSHEPVQWHGSPVSGRWVGGCPGDPLVNGGES